MSKNLAVTAAIYTVAALCQLRLLPWFALSLTIVFLFSRWAFDIHDRTHARGKYPLLFKTMHQPIASEDEAQAEFYPQALITQQTSVTLHTVYSVSQDQARKIVEQAFVSRDRRFSAFGIVSVVAGAVIGFGLFWLIG